MIPVANFVHRTFTVLHQSIPVSHAIQAVCNSPNGCVLVRGPGGQAAGILTKHDLCCRGLANGRNLADLNLIPIEQIMTKQLIYAEQECHITDVIHLMEHFGVRRIPIVRKENNSSLIFTAIVTLDDLIIAEQITPHQLSKITRKYLSRKIRDFKTKDPEHTNKQSRHQIRSEFHKADTLHRFYSHLSKFIGLEFEQLPSLTNLILTLLARRVTPSAASHLFAQLPQCLHELLSTIPIGPDRKYTSQRIVYEISKKFHVSLEQAQFIFSNFILGLYEWMNKDTLNKFKSQLPCDFHPYFKFDNSDYLNKESA